MRQLIQFPRNFDYATPVLITEKAMRRAAETYINTNTSNKNVTYGDYINEDGYNRRSRLAKIYIHFYPNKILVEKSCDYSPEYLCEEDL